MAQNAANPLPNKYLDETYLTTNGRTKHIPSLGWFWVSWNNNKRDKEEAAEALRNYIMEYAMTDKEWKSFRRYSCHQEKGNPIYGTLGIIETTIRSLETRRKVVAARKKREEKAEDHILSQKTKRELEGIDFLIKACKERRRILKREIKKLEKKQEEQV